LTTALGDTMIRLAIFARSAPESVKIVQRTPLIALPVPKGWA